MPHAARSPKFQAVAAASLAPSPPHFYAGTSGWAYPSWKPGFYPANVPARAFLHVYAARLTSVEVNYTFRDLPAPEQLQGWVEATPPGFLFTFKVPQSITHWKRLQACEEEIAAFVASLEPVRAASRLGVLLFQLPPNFRSDLTRLGVLLGGPALAGSRVVFEFRHESWFTEETYSLLRAHNAALCVAETDDLKTPDIATAGFRYYRLRRSCGYSPREISAFAKHLLPPAEGPDTFVYFKHEDEPTGALHAAALLTSANRLARRSAARTGGK